MYKNDPMYIISVRLREFQDPANFCLWNPESWEFSSRKSGIQLMIGILNPSSTDKESRIQYLQSRIYGVESRIQDCLGFLYMGQTRNQKLISCHSIYMHSKVHSLRHMYTLAILGASSPGCSGLFPPPLACSKFYYGTVILK